MSNTIQVGQTYRIKSISSQVDKSFRRKLLSMGLCPNAYFSVTRLAPLGDPVELCVGEDYALSIRKKELDQLTLMAI